MNRATCPSCKREFGRMLDGGFWPHGTKPPSEDPNAARCPGSRRMPDGTEPPLAD